MPTAYPSHSWALDSQLVPENGADDDFSQSGIQHARILHDRRYWRFRLVHHITLAQLNTLEALYNAGQRDDYTLTDSSRSPAVTYTVKFTEPPAITTNHGANRFEVTTNLRGYKN